MDYTQSNKEGFNQELSSTDLVPIFIPDSYTNSTEELFKFLFAKKVAAASRGVSFHPTVLFGAPGIGKTAIIQQAAEQCQSSGALFKTIDWRDVKPEEYGVHDTYRYTSEGKEEYFSYSDNCWKPVVPMDNTGILLVSLNGFSEASREEYNKIYSLIKSCDNSNWSIILECRQEEDLDRLTRDRGLSGCFALSGLAPMPEEWLNWAEGSDGHGKRRVCNEIVAFIKTHVGVPPEGRPHWGRMTREEALKVQRERYGWLHRMYDGAGKCKSNACPKSWEALSNLLRSAATQLATETGVALDINAPLSILEVSKLNDEDNPLRHDIIATVGEEPALAFIEYLRSHN